MEHKVSNELPPIQGESMPGQDVSQGEALRPEVVSEQQAAQAVEAPAVQAVPPQYQVPVPPQQIAQDPAAPGAAPSGLPVIADDADLIEKEWVEKAKEIVARTRQDPYLQNKEVERMKADYMKKRYNKDIRVTED